LAGEFLDYGSMETEYRAFDNDHAAGHHDGKKDSASDGKKKNNLDKVKSWFSVLRSVVIHLCYVSVASLVIVVLKWNLVNVPKEDKTQWAFHNVTTYRNSNRV
jgi:hypothetical protein